MFPSSPWAPPEETLLSAWQSQVREAAKKPWLLQELLQRGPRLLPRFVRYYARLRALPRQTRRALQRKLGRSLAGAALLLALSPAPGLAAKIKVNGATCTLVDAITAANTNTATGGCKAGKGADTLDLKTDVTLSAVNNSIYYGSTGLPVISSPITIKGNDHTITRDSGASEFRIFAISSTGNLTLKNTTVSGGVAAFGGGVYNQGTVTLTNSTVSGNSAFSGGGVDNYQGTVTLTNSTVSGNSAYFGGGVDNYGTVTLTNSTVSGNAAVYGGGVNNYYGTVTLINSTVSGNSAYSGGGVHNDEGALTLTNSTVSGNSASYQGGGVANFSGPVTLINSTVSGNSANSVHSRGGGVENYYGTVTLTNSTVLGNSAYLGGGVFNNGALTLTDSTLSGNSATYGGGVYSFGSRDRTLTLTNSTVSGNSAYRGGGVHNSSYSYYYAVTLTDSTVSGNSAYRGGGVYNGSALTLTNSTVSGNSASSGGGVDNNGALTLTNSTVSGNSASSGGGVANSYGTLTLAHTLVSGNIALTGAEVFTGVAITADNSNLFGHSGLTNAQAFANFTPGASDLTATSDGTVPTALTDILDTTLQDNGGPTDTHDLVAGSPAIDAVLAGCPPPDKDQRGVERPQGVACDIGAVEFIDSDGDDSDGDGVDDGQDQCPGTLSSPGTVIVDECNSGVADFVGAEGCSISQELAAIAAGARNHGQFVSQSAQFLQDLVRVGDLTRAEKGAIMDCVRKSDLP